jgi:DNA replication protein DnaC
MVLLRKTYGKEGGSMKTAIRELCMKLRIGNIISENYEGIEAETHEEFLFELLRKAVDDRDTNRKNRLLKQANFDMIKTFDNYSFEDIQLSDRLPLENLKQGTFTEERENLILYGGVGTGKTHMATAIGVNAVRSGKKVKFFRTASLVNKLVEANARGTLGTELKNINSADLIICDEWGYIPIHEQGAQLLFQVIADCYEKRSVIITTNLDFNNWNSIFYNEKLTSAIIDRLIHHSHLIVFSGKSYRLRNSLMK